MATKGRRCGICHTRLHSYVSMHNAVRTYRPRDFKGVCVPGVSSGGYAGYVCRRCFEAAEATVGSVHWPVPWADVEVAVTNTIRGMLLVRREAVG